MRTRIVHVASGREWRGGQNQVRLLARALHRSDDFDQVVVTGRGTGSPPGSCKGSGARNGVETALDPRALLAVGNETRRGGVILHAHDAHALVLAGLVSSVVRAPLVVTRRVDFHLRRPGFWARADRVIAISQAVQSVLVSDGISADRITVIHSGIDPDEVREARPAGVRATLGLAPNLPLAVNVGALVPHKDHATLLAAAARLRMDFPQLHWAIAGEGPERDRLKQVVRVSGLEDRVHFLGQISNPWGLIAEADVFVMSSREEGLGTSVLDAMALGIPVAATAAGGLPEILADGAGLLVPVGDGVALAGAVETLIRDPGARQQVQKGATSRLFRFTDRAMAEGVGSVYRSILPTG